MRWSIGNQILVPFAATLAIAVATIAVAAAWLAAHGQEAEAVGQLQRVVATLGRTNFPYTANVLEQMRGLSGAEFIAISSSGGPLSSTMPEGVAEEIPPLPLVDDVDSFTNYRAIEVRGTLYLAARVRTSTPTTLIVLYPERRRIAAKREAAWPPLAIGATTGVIMVGVSVWLSRRLSRRIDAVQALFARIAAGDFAHAPAGPPHDELHDLVLSANTLSDQLRGMRATIGHTERMRVVAQLAGGFAHQLRNSLTGVRMAVQLHQRRCSDRARRDDLNVAMRQLSLTEEQIIGLLTLGTRRETADVSGPLIRLLTDVEELVGPACRHAHVRFESDYRDSGTWVGHYGRLRASLLNLVLNAIEAAGTGGSVKVRSERTDQELHIEVSDSGAGPREEFRESLFEPFATSKPEGIGLGLAIVRQTAEELGGSVTWFRADGSTIFTLSLPIRNIASAAPPSSASRESAASPEIRETSASSSTRLKG